MSVRVERVGLGSPMKGNRSVAQALPAYCSLGFNTIILHTNPNEHHHPTVVSHTGPSSPSFKLVLNNALKAYEKQTKNLNDSLARAA